VYAPLPNPVPAPLVVRLIGVLDADLVAAFGALERGLAGARGATVVVDVRDVDVLGETEIDALAELIGTARREGRDVRLEARSLHWRRAAKKHCSGQPPVDAQLRSAVRRTVIVAHSHNPKRKRR
jgi:anti-anti-sigma regulatory factor